MTVFRQALQEIRDTQRHVDRKTLYGSRGHFPIPTTNRNSLLASKPKVLRTNTSIIYEESARNKQNLDNLQSIANLFKEDLKVQVS